MEDAAPEHAAVIELFKGQLLIALVRRLGSDVSIPVAEVDATGNVNLSLAVEDAPGGPRFRLVVTPKAETLCRP